MLRPSGCIGGAMRKLVIVGASIAIVLVGVYLAYHFLTLGPAYHALVRAWRSPVRPCRTSVPGPTMWMRTDARISMPPTTSALSRWITTKSMQDAQDDHTGMAFYVNPDRAQAVEVSRCLVCCFASDCSRVYRRLTAPLTHPKGVIGAGQPFLPSSDDFSVYQWSHTSGDRKSAGRMTSASR